MRVDFNGRHRNPEVATDKVPDIFKPFAGEWIEESHIHYFIEDYKPLQCAIPLTRDDSFAIKEFSDVYELSAVIQEFGRKINLQTTINTTIQSVLL